MPIYSQTITYFKHILANLRLDFVLMMIILQYNGSIRIIIDYDM